MKKVLFAFAFIALFAPARAQDEPTGDTLWKDQYRATATRISDLVHTKLVVSFDYNKAWMFGKEWITLHPHFYSTDSLTLDAKGMEIKEIALMKGGSKIPLKYSYDSMQLKITLDKLYK